MSHATRTRVDLLEVARRIAREPHGWSAQPRFDPARRWFSCLADDPGAQVWLLTWLPGQGTDLHDHGGSAGAFTVVQGVLTEETPTAAPSGLTTLVEDTVTTGHGHRFGEHHVHRMTNNGPIPAISIHVYAPTLATMNRYELTGGRLSRTATDRAGLSW
jgi:predicted metal-dependent enzyme (double-stranded beta helix superfamily)